MGEQAAFTVRERDWVNEYRRVRAVTERICEPLEIDDYQLQSITETSPPKWHIAHVSWFFETFLLRQFLPNYRVYDERFGFLFNSYYETVGPMHPRPKRGLLSRPIVAQVYEYRAHVDRYVLQLLDSVSGQNRAEVLFRLELGLNHEQQHQELLFMDIKHNFFVNPMRPAYRHDLVYEPGKGAMAANWVDCAGGICHVGADGGHFAFDNETPRHRVLLRDYRLADRLVTNAEFQQFVEDRGYAKPALWLADGWHRIQTEGWRHPLYWVEREATWYEFTLAGLRLLEPSAPVCHLSYYEADAFARWAGQRLPTEAELEQALAAKPLEGNFAETDALHPIVASAQGQWFGDLWNWTATPYGAYPGFTPLRGAMGEYNGKFMCNQVVLKGGSCVTPMGHMRPSYRNFFYPHDRWMFSGLRLAQDL